MFPMVLLWTSKWLRAGTCTLFPVLASFYIWGDELLVPEKYTDNKPKKPQIVQLGLFWFIKKIVNQKTWETASFAEVI